MKETIREVVRMYFEPLTLKFWRRKPRVPDNAAFTANQQREIDTTYEELKEKIKAMRQ
jgi:hypothetical protein